MPLISAGRFVADTWQRPLDGPINAAAGEEARYILPLGRLLAEGETLAAAGHALGVEIPNDADLDVLEPWLARLGLIVVAFPKSADGRGFSIAARLRRSGFRGELRANGHVIADQYALATSCGFDTVEITAAQAERQPEAHWTAAARAMTLAYQQEPGELRSILSARWGN